MSEPIRWTKLSVPPEEPCQGADCSNDAEYKVDVELGDASFEVLACELCAADSDLAMGEEEDS